MNRIGIIGAMGFEVEHLREMMRGREETSAAGRTFYAGKIGNRDVVLVCSGIGKVNSAMSAQILIDRFGVDAIINTGIAGGAKGAKVRDVVISTEAAYHDMELRLVALSPPHLERFAADKVLVQKAQKACEDCGVTCHLGRIATGDQFISDSAQKTDIVSRLDPSAIEMEGGAVAHVCAANGVPFVIIRSISDNADDEAQMSYDAFEQLAADDAAKIVADMLGQM